MTDDASRFGGHPGFPAAPVVSLAKSPASGAGEAPGAVPDVVTPSTDGPAPDPWPNGLPSPRRGPRPGVLLILVGIVAVLAAGSVVVWRTGIEPSSSSSSDRAASGPGLPAGVAPGAGSMIGSAGVGSMLVAVPAQAPDSVDAAGSSTSYQVGNLTDGRLDTCWRMAGDATGTGIMITLDRPTALGQVGLVNGYAKTDPRDGTDRYGQERRILRVTWQFSDGTSLEQVLSDGVRTLQAVSTGSSSTVSWIYLSIDAVTPPGDPGFDYTAVSELHLSGG